MAWFKTRRSKNAVYDQTVSVPGHPLDARHANPSIEGSMANQFNKQIVDLKKEAFSGNYNDLANKPQSLPASDVYSWAKQPNKPSYNASEVGAAASSHEHSKLSDLEIGRYNYGGAGYNVYTESDSDCATVGCIRKSNNNVGASFWFYNDRIKSQNILNVLQLQPYIASLSKIGESDERWVSGYFNNLYNSSGVITSSDKNMKKDFEQITQEFADAIIDGLIPTSFLYKDGTSGRRHYALIAQDVEKLIESLGIDSKDFAPLVKDYPTKVVKSENKDEPPARVSDYDAEPEYSLRYEGFIGIIIKYIQGLKSQISNMQSKYDALEKRVAALEKANG